PCGGQGLTSFLRSRSAHVADPELGLAIPKTDEPSEHASAHITVALGYTPVAHPGCGIPTVPSRAVFGCFATDLSTSGGRPPQCDIPCNCSLGIRGVLVRTAATELVRPAQGRALRGSRRLSSAPTFSGAGS